VLKLVRSRLNDSDKYKKIGSITSRFRCSVRLVFDGSSVLALFYLAQQRDMGEWNMFRFASMRPDEIVGSVKLSAP
jgi:hypothetical protein